MTSHTLEVAAAPRIPPDSSQSDAPQLSPEIKVRTDRGGPELIDRFCAPWRELCDHSASRPFHRPEWVASYVRAFEPLSTVVLVTAWIGNDLAAVLPLLRKRIWSAGLPAVQLVGAANVHSVGFDLVRDASPIGDLAVAKIWDELKAMRDWDVITLPTYAAESGCAMLIALGAVDGFRTFVATRHDGPILRMKADASGRLTWNSNTSRHFRHELRRYARILEQQIGGPPTLVRHMEARLEVLERFYALEHAGWKGRNGTAIISAEETRSFYDRIARDSAAQGRFCLHFLERGGRIAAAAFSLITDRCYFPLKITYDEALHRAAPGNLLMNAILEECAGRGIQELYFGGSAERFKNEWTQDKLLHYEGTIFSRTLRAQVDYRIRTSGATVFKMLRKASI